MDSRSIQTDPTTASLSAAFAGPSRSSESSHILSDGTTPCASSTSQSSCSDFAQLSDTENKKSVLQTNLHNPFHAPHHATEHYGDENTYLHTTNTLGSPTPTNPISIPSAQEPVTPDQPIPEPATPQAPLRTRSPSFRPINEDSYFAFRPPQRALLYTSPPRYSHVWDAFSSELREPSAATLAALKDMRSLVLSSREADGAARFGPLCTEGQQSSASSSISLPRSTSSQVGCSGSCSVGNEGRKRKREDHDYDEDTIHVVSPAVATATTAAGNDDDDRDTIKCQYTTAPFSFRDILNKDFTLQPVRKSRKLSNDSPCHQSFSGDASLKCRSSNYSDKRPYIAAVSNLNEKEKKDDDKPMTLKEQISASVQPRSSNASCGSRRSHRKYDVDGFNWRKVDSPLRKLFAAAATSNGCREGNERKDMATEDGADIDGEADEEEDARSTSSTSTSSSSDDSGTSLSDYYYGFC